MRAPALLCLGSSSAAASHRCYPRVRRPCPSVLTGIRICAHAALQLASAAVRLARAAIEMLDLRQHAASHPRLGVVDHVSLQPAGKEATLEAAAEVARAIGVSAIFHVVLHTALLHSDVKLDANQSKPL